MSLYSRLFACYYDRFQSEYEEYIVPHKRELFEGASGTFEPNPSPPVPRWVSPHIIGQAVR